MKFPGLLCLALMIAGASLQAQVTVEVSLAQDQFLAGEDMPVTVRVINRSGQILRFGDSADWLTFSVESKAGYVVTRQGEVPVDDEEFFLGSSKMAKKVVNMAPYFMFSKPGRYTVTASVLIKEWNQQVSSAPVSFDIIIGSKMWEQEVGLPRSSDSANSAPELRRYALHQANYLRTRLMLYVQITDSTGKVIKVFPIGPLLSFGQPEPQVDPQSNLHVLYQDGPRTYSYTVIDPHGTIVTRHSYDMAPRPRLTVASNGSFEIVGGLRRVKSSDIPAPKPAENDAAIRKP
jgi:hypothetical protein